jgi:hypothetical protein
MPYPPGHRAAIRQKIVESARRLFNLHLPAFHVS